MANKHNSKRVTKSSVKKLTASDALALSIPERIQLVEDIWDSIVAEADDIALTDEDKKIIDERLKAFHKNPDLGSPWSEVYERITESKS